jgi:hypothetical protein
MSLSRHKAEESFRLSSILVLSLVVVATTQIVSQSWRLYDAIVLDKLLHLLVLNVIFTPSARPDRTPATRLLFRFVPCCSSAYGLYIWIGWGGSRLRKSCDDCIYIAWFGIYGRAQDPTFMSLFSSMHILNLTFNITAFMVQLRLEARAAFALISSRGLKTYYASAKRKQQKDHARLARLKDMARQDWFFWFYWSIFWVFEHLDRPNLQFRHGFQIDGPFLLLYRIVDYIITLYFLEHVVKINKSMLIESAPGWGFSQILSMLAVISPVILLLRAFIDPEDKWRGDLSTDILSKDNENDESTIDLQGKLHYTTQWERVRGIPLYKPHGSNVKHYV